MVKAAAGAAASKRAIGDGTKCIAVKVWQYSIYCISGAYACFSAA